MPPPNPQPPLDLSLVIPLFNEEAVFPHLISQLNALLATLNLRTEVILIDDGSSDQTPALIQSICTTNPNYRGLILSRNFGHQLAITAGMAHSSGNAVAILDGDLQDPPEVIAEFYSKLREGYDVVYAIRHSRKENIFKRLSYSLFYRLMRTLSSIPIPLDSGDFCLMSRRVVDQLNAMPERHRFVRGLRSWVGFRQTGHPYPRAARHAGKSKYSFRKLLRLAFDGIFTFTEKPLQWSAQFGLLVAVCSTLYALYIIFWRLFSNQVSNATNGFATLAVGLFFMGGVQLVSIGILGEYIARIHTEVKARPLFIIQSRFNFPNAPPS